MSSSGSSASSCPSSPPAGSLSSLRSSRLPSFFPPVARVDSLLRLCTHQLSLHLDSVATLEHLPEEVVQELLYLVLMRSELTPALCQLFAACGHDSVVDWIADNIDTSAIYVASTRSCRERW
jgi:hypothetical protein